MNRTTAPFIGAIILLLAACAEPEKSNPRFPVTPTGPRYSGGGTGGIGSYAAASSQPDVTEDGNFRPGACMGTEAYLTGLTQGMKSENDLNCTSNDVSITGSFIREYSYDGVTYFQFDPGFSIINCSDGDPLFLRLAIKIAQNASGARNDIGIWTPFGDDQTAMTGFACGQFTLVPGSPGVSDLDGDQCGDLESGSRIAVGLGVSTAICRDDGTGFLHFPACVGWSQSGSDRNCPVPGATGYRSGSVPGSKSKCNCAGFDVAVNVF